MNAAANPICTDYQNAPPPHYWIRSGGLRHQRQFDGRLPPTEGDSPESGAAGGKLNVADVRGQSKGLTQVDFVLLFHVVLQEEIDESGRQIGATDGETGQREFPCAVLGLERARGRDPLRPFEYVSHHASCQVVGMIPHPAQLVKIHVCSSPDMVRHDMDLGVMQGRGQELTPAEFQVGIRLVVRNGDRVEGARGARMSLGENGNFGGEVVCCGLRDGAASRPRGEHACERRRKQCAKRQ